MAISLGDATFFSTVLQSREIPLKSRGQQISQPLPGGMLLILRTAQISDEDLGHTSLCKGSAMRRARFTAAGSIGAGAICARHGELAANPTKKLSTRNGEVLLIVSPMFPPYGDPPGARNSQLSSK
jgi:hypothetical protein